MLGSFSMSFACDVVVNSHCVTFWRCFFKSHYKSAEAWRCTFCSETFGEDITASVTAKSNKIPATFRIDACFSLTTVYRLVVGRLVGRWTSQTFQIIIVSFLSLNLVRLSCARYSFLVILMNFSELTALCSCRSLAPWPEAVNRRDVKTARSDCHRLIICMKLA